MSWLNKFLRTATERVFKIGDGSTYKIVKSMCAYKIEKDGEYLGVIWPFSEQKNQLTVLVNILGRSKETRFDVSEMIFIR